MDNLLKNKSLMPIRPSLPIGSLNAYIQSVYQIPMLTAEEEKYLAEQLQQNGDMKAAQRLVLSHLRYVVKVAKSYAGYGLNIADLVQEGSVGLMKAVKRFDPSVGVRLVSFAVHWIKAEIHEFVLRNWRIVKVATTKAQRKLFFNLRSAKKRLGWFSLAEKEMVAADLNVKVAEVELMEQRLNAMDTTFDLPIELEDSGKKLIAPAEYLISKNTDPAKILETSNWQAVAKDKLQHALAKLDDRSQDILRKRWLSENKTTLKELAVTYNLSLERIRQLEKLAINQLRVDIGQELKVAS